MAGDSSLIDVFDTPVNDLEIGDNFKVPAAPDDSSLNILGSGNNSFSTDDSPVNATDVVMSVDKEIVCICGRKFRSAKAKAGHCRHSQKCQIQKRQRPSVYICACHRRSFASPQALGGHLSYSYRWEDTFTEVLVSQRRRKCIKRNNLGFDNKKHRLEQVIKQITSRLLQ